MSHKIGKTLLISALISILLMSSQTLFATSQIIEPPDPLPQQILDRLRSFHSAFNLQIPGSVLQSFIDDSDPDGPPAFEIEGITFIGQADIAQGLTNFFAAHPGATLEEICLVDWYVDFEDGDAGVILLSIGVEGEDTIELMHEFYLVRRGNDWLIVFGEIEEVEEELECLMPLFQGAVGGVTASTNKLTVAAPYLVIVGLIAGLALSTVYVIKKRKD